MPCPSPPCLPPLQGAGGARTHSDCVAAAALTAPARLTCSTVQGAGDAASGPCGPHAPWQVLPPLHQEVFRARDAKHGEAAPQLVPAWSGELENERHSRRRLIPAHSSCSPPPRSSAQPWFQRCCTSSRCPAPSKPACLCRPPPKSSARPWCQRCSTSSRCRSTSMCWALVIWTPLR